MCFGKGHHFASVKWQNYLLYSTGSWQAVDNKEFHLRNQCELSAPQTKQWWVISNATLVTKNHIRTKFQSQYSQC
jgi:hypothetical protein